MQTNVQVHSGNRIQIEFDGQAIGLIQSVRPSDSYGLESASGIGDIHTIENVPTKATHELSVSMMVLKKKNMRQLGLLPQNGDDALKGLVFDIVSYDKDTQKAMWKYTGCSYDSGDMDVSAHRITMASGRFKALNRFGSEA
ncbi:MAG: hypothetical protein E7K72_26200 [Roseomonas mucosa]|nr:hypothetical protein [Roseomonas mucosa]